MTTYRIYRYRIMNGEFDYYAATQPMSKTDAMEYKHTMYDTMKKPTYTTIIVSSKREEEFLTKCAQKAEQVKRKFARMEKIKEYRWAVMDEAYRQGYKVRDAIDYLNKK